MYLHEGVRLQLGVSRKQRLTALLDATTNLSRPVWEKGIHPAVDPLGSTSRILDP